MESLYIHKILHDQMPSHLFLPGYGNIRPEKEMKTLRLYSPGNLRLQTEDTPTPEDGEALLRVKAVGLCGSDLHWLQEGGIGDTKLTNPLILGHEAAGEIIMGARKGERVAIDPLIPCSQCRYCQQGHPNLCPTQRFAGHGDLDGAMCEVMAWPDKLLYTLPEKISAVEGAMLEPLGVALHAVDLAKVQIGMRVGVFGCGPIGLLIVQLLQLKGVSQIVATEKLPHRIQAAKAFGDIGVFPANEALDQILAATNGAGLDVCIEVAGDNEAVEIAVASARPGACVVLVGIPTADRTTFSASIARRKGLNIKLSRRMKHVYPRAIQLVYSDKVDVAGLVTHRYSLHDFEKAMDTATHREGLKVIIEPT